MHINLFNINNIKNNPTPQKQNFGRLFAFKKDVFEKTSNNHQLSFDEKIKKATMGKYQKQFLEIFNLPKNKEEILKQINDGTTSEDNMLSILKQLSTSTFKIAMDNPDQYINHTQDGNYKIYCGNCVMNNKQPTDSEYIKEMFGKNFIHIFNALKTIDTDTLNQMLDKRSSSFLLMLDGLRHLDEEHLKILSKLVKQVQQGRANDKIKLFHIVSITQDKKIDTSELENILQNGKLSTKEINSTFNSFICKSVGCASSNIDISTPVFNEEYAYLLLNKNALRECGAPPTSEKEYSAIIENIFSGRDFFDFIHDESNIFGQTNLRTKQQFINNGLNYDKWLNPKIPAQVFNCQGKTMKAQLWNRDPKEDLFIGNKTKCCTAIGNGINSAAMPIFLTNTAFNYIEVKDESNKTQAAARIYMGNFHFDRPSIIIDSIELAEEHTLTDEEKRNIRNNIFKYIKNYSKEISNKQLDIYFVDSDKKVPLDDFDESANDKMWLIGDLSADKVYSNMNSSFKWQDIRNGEYSYFIKIT